MKALRKYIMEGKEEEEPVEEIKEEESISRIRQQINQERLEAQSEQKERKTMFIKLTLE